MCMLILASGEGSVIFVLFVVNAALESVNDVI